MNDSLSLIIFTVLSQLAFGAFVMLWVYDKWGKQTISKGTGFTVALSIVLVMAVALLASLFHLGHPIHAYKALLNVGESWLSREIVFFGLFFGVTAIYALLWRTEDTKKRDLIGWVAAISGLLGVFASAMIYMIPSMPAWDSIFTLLFFMLTPAVVGPLFVAMFLTMKKEVTFNFSKIAVVAILVSLATLVIYLFTLSSGLAEAAATGEVLMASMLFWVRIATLVIGLGIVGFGLTKKDLNYSYYGALFALLIIGEFIGRALFYTTAVPL